MGTTDASTTQDESTNDFSCACTLVPTDCGTLTLTGAGSPTLQVSGKVTFSLARSPAGNTAPSSLGMVSGEGGLQAMSAVVAGSRDSC